MNGLHRPFADSAQRRLQLHPNGSCTNLIVVCSLRSGRLTRSFSILPLQQYRFDFNLAEKPYESYSGLNVRLRYFVRVTIATRGKNVTRETEFVVQNIQQASLSILKVSLVFVSFLLALFVWDSTLRRGVPGSGKIWHFCFSKRGPFRPVRPHFPFQVIVVGEPSRSSGRCTRLACISTTLIPPSSRSQAASTTPRQQEVIPALLFFPPLVDSNIIQSIVLVNINIYLGPPQEPEALDSLKMEVGIEDCLHIEFEYDKSAYHLQDVVIGKVRRGGGFGPGDNDHAHEFPVAHSCRLLRITASLLVSTSRRNRWAYLRD